MEKEPIKGELYHREKSQRYLFVLDDDIGAVYCFKRKVNQIRSKVLILSGCEFLDYPNCLLTDSGYVPSFDFRIDDQTYAVLSQDAQKLSSIKSQFQSCSKFPIPLSYRKCCRVFRGLGFILSIPFKFSNALCSGLEVVGDKFNQAPDRVFKIPINKSQRKMPSNFATGIFMGTGKMLIGIVKGIGGLIYEPYKGAKESGFKGATKGIGKGILGLIFKPMAGTIDFVTCTVRGVSNTPASVYRMASRYYKNRKLKKQGQIDLTKFVDNAPYTPQIIGDYDDEDPDNNENHSNVNKETEEVIDPDELIFPILERNNKLRQWIMELSKILCNEPKLYFEEIGEEDDIIECRVQEAKEIGKYLKTEVVDLIENLKKIHEESQLNIHTVNDFNTRIVSNLKDLGIDVTGAELLKIASDIEESLMSDEDLISIKEPEPVIVPDPPKPKPVVIVNPFIEKAKSWRPSVLKDDYRVPEAGPNGGIPLVDDQVLNKLRAVGKEIIKSLGREILRGNFNLTTVSFPIKCMQPTTTLHNTLKSMTLGPLFFTKAGLTSNPIERLKFLACGTMGTYRNTSAFLKPLNPIIGETLNAELEDGTQMYCEQTCNHPPTSHFYVVGPDNVYTMSGYAIFSTSAGFNSLTLKNQGKKQIKFKDGSLVTITFPDDQFVKTFIGTMRQETFGSFVIDDKRNKLQCLITIGSVKGKVSDYVEGVIVEDGQRIVSKLSGTYLGYFEFDGIRYWDARETPAYVMIPKTILPSDSDLREDLKLLRDDLLNEAQAAKEKLENIQRNDRRLRELHRRK